MNNMIDFAFPYLLQVIILAFHGRKRMGKVKKLIYSSIELPVSSSSDLACLDHETDLWSSYAELFHCKFENNKN